QKGETTIETLIQQGEYAQAAIEAERMIAINPRDGVLHLQHADALHLMGRFTESENSYRRAMEINSRDAAAREGLALSMAHQKVQLDKARSIMEETIATLPEIQEFQALSLAFILLESGNRDEALRVFSDNLELLQTRFEMDYTDPDDLLAETVYLYGVLSREVGESAEVEALMQKVVDWAPGSVFAEWAAVSPTSDPRRR
ncbi:MAG TPA: BTAD domain-containing putative transcriptional regulator, partial [Thermoanaerobaculia bacterium]|nr:BTAD domain-containing putative transcriptional regulator [Thermoanaerobaculia bacterium]